MEPSVQLDRLPVPPAPERSRYILARLEALTLAVPLAWASEILVVDRALVMHLPFYDRALLGIARHGGALVPLVSLKQLLGMPEGTISETFQAVRLGAKSEEFAGTAIAVDAAIGSCSEDELPADVFTSREPVEHPDTGRPFLLLRLEMLRSRPWQQPAW